MTSRPDVAATAAFLEDRLGGRRPSVAIVLGSGLGGLVERMEDPAAIPYDHIPGFPASTVAGHAGELVIGRLAGVDVLAQRGRFHLYEGHDADLVALPVRAFAQVGVGTLIFTNAAGGVRRTLTPGSLVVIADHVNLTFRNPLIGSVLEHEQRFPDMSSPYDPDLRNAAHRVAAAKGIALSDGVYAGLLGPSYETPSEVRMLERLGVDIVGMSTVLEVIAAVARGVRCLGISTVTNPAAGIGGAALDHADVLEIGHLVGRHLADLIEGVVGEMRAEG